MRIFEINDKIDAELKNSSFLHFITTAKKLSLKYEDVAREIILHVKKNGDEALIEYSNRFDKTHFCTAQDFIVNEKEIDQAKKNIDKNVYEALQMAYRRIVSYHKKQLPEDFSYQDEEGVELANIWRSIKTIGVYAPGGSASYPSSVLMCAAPAIVAGVKDIILTVPSNGQKISDAVLVAADICGIKKIYKIGGAQAIAAMCYGTSTIDKVDKIVGPGNAYVAAAKKILYGEVGIDMIAGPTDVTIICDDDNNANWIAADALSQLEHGPDSKAYIITDNKEFARKIIESIAHLSKNLPRRFVIEKSLENSAIFIIKDIAQSVDIANFIAAEHLEISCKNAKKLVEKINNAGAIFVGKYTPESIGDYIAGPSHTLPTEGTSRFASGLSVYDFLKRISLISCNKDSFDKLAKAASDLAASEGLDAHKLSIDIRK